MRLAVLLLLFSVASFAQQYYSVYKEGSRWSVKPGKDTSAVTFGYWNNTYLQTGWSRLFLQSNNAYPNEDQMYGAGYLEGYFTHSMISDNFQNTFPNGSQAVSPGVYHWLSSNAQFMNNIISSSNSPVVKQANYLLSQLRGISDAYKNFYNPKTDIALEYTDFVLLQLAGDMETLAKVGAGTISPGFGQRCSALIRVTPDFSKLFSGHTTWSTFASMLRIYKYYNIPLSNTDAGTNSPIVSFSSYPGVLSSIDDFYQTSQKLNVIETTNGYYVDTLNKFVVPESLLSWMRVMIANRIAKNGEEWTDIFSQFNSGTYNNQWMVVDYSKFTPGKPLPAGLLWILEQIPGYVHKQDMTEVLALSGYWSSYNMPYFRDIFEVSGFPGMVAKYGLWFTHELHPRAKIFRRDQYKVNDIKDMAYQMQYNEWTHDSFSEGNPGNQISSRFDLVTKQYADPFLNKNCFGGIDSKITSDDLMQDLVSWAISGPTHQNPTATPPFQWKDWPSISHKGHPDVFNFTWQTMSW